MKNGRLIAILLALLAVVVALSAISFRSGAPVRFGVTAGPDSWWACALPGYSGSDYTVAVYPDEAALLAKDLQVDWGIPDMDYLQRGTIYLEGEIVELRKKPTYPVGETMIDAFGRRPTYVDRGTRLRGLVAFGRADAGDLESLICREPGMTIIGGSSDHCIVDVEDCPRVLQVGDIVGFDLSYGHMLYATGRSDVSIVYTDA